MLAVLVVINLGYHRFLISLLGLDKDVSVDPLIEAGYGFGTLVLFGCLAPGIVEEIAFRGIIQTSLSKEFSDKKAILITSGMFAIAHISLLSWPYLFLSGIVLGVFRLRSQSLLPVIVIHFLHNFVIYYIEFFNPGL
ncbi:MAG: CPBP family intramembrane metalloprotease [bacterium]|nr:CPBP family intramembrane metalloprotease [bacterium]